MYNSGNFVKTIDLSKPVGNVDGSAAATASGGVTYSIPIYTPPGTNGMEPSVAIVYNSQGGAGVVGFGWNISGLSVISRTGKNIYHNGVVKPVSYTAEDAFLLDGMKLNAITGNNGGDMTEYAGEAESFTKIISHTTGSPDDPDWFEVIAKDGTKMQFGNTTDSRMVTDDGFHKMLWRLNRIIDINGNYVDFKYDNSSRDSRIDEINYTGNTYTGLLPYNKIKFYYGYRNETNTGYDGGASLSSIYLLNKITVTTQGDDISGEPLPSEQVKTYQFNYGFDNVHSLLKEVIESGVGITSAPALNSTIFLYGDEPAGIFVQTAVPVSNGECLTGDFNADGKTDIVASSIYYDNFIKYSSGYTIYLNPQSSVYHYNKPLPPGHTVIENKKFVNFLTSDYNMDGRDDIFLVQTSAVTQPSGAVLRYLNRSLVEYTTDAGYLESVLPIGSSSNSFRIHESGNFLIPGDFDGDGNQDIITILGTTTPSGGVSYTGSFSSPAKFNFNKKIWNFTVDANYSALSIAEAKHLFPMDLDGDGKQEVWVTHGTLSYVLKIEPDATNIGEYNASQLVSSIHIDGNHKIFPGDFNGDRKTDLLVKAPSGNWKIYFSNGKDFVETPFNFNQTVNLANNDKIVIADFNGDGKSDILHGFPVWVNGVSNSSKFSVYYSKGFLYAASFYYQQYDYNKVLPNVDLVSGDFNGDGRSDILLKHFYADPPDIVYFKPNGKERLLAKVTDGHNVTSSFDYKLLTDKTTYPIVYNRTVPLGSTENINPFNYVQLPIYVVSSVTAPDGIGGSTTNSYFYEDAVIHRYAKGFLGFKKITSVNNTSFAKTITENNINTQFAVPYTVKNTALLAGQYPLPDEIINETFITNSFVNLSIGSQDIRYFQKMDKTLSVDHLNGTASESVNTYDNYGNITTNVSKIGVLSGTTVDPTETTTTTTAFGYHNTPFPAKPDNITVSNLRTSQPSVSTTSTFTYTTNGLPASQTAFSGLPKAVTTSYTYNTFGNATQVTTSASGLTSRIAKATFDTKGRFPLTKQAAGTAINQTVTYTYDNKWGKPLSQTSPDCLTTTFEYDAFGRMKKTTMPEGYAVNNTLVWDIQGEQLFYSFTDFPGGKPDSKTWFDKLGREIKTQAVGFNSQWLTQLTSYDYKGNVYSKTNSYYATETPVVTTTGYDDYNRPRSVTNPLSTITSIYSKLSNGKMQVTTQNSAGQSSSKITDAAGKVISAIDNGGQLNYTYDSRGNQVETKHGTTIMVTSAYDVYGRQTSLVDKNAGTVTYQYDAFGQLTQQTDNIGNIYTMLYDNFGRVTSRIGTEGTTTYEYFKVGKGINSCNNNSIAKVTGFNGVVKEYTYDNLRRLQSEKVTVDGQNFISSFTYDAYSNPTSTTYPSGVVVNNYYDNSGNLTSITGGDSWNPITLFTANAENGYGQLTSYTLGNGKTSQNTYQYGMPTRLYTSGVQDLNLSFDFTKGNLNSRYDALKNLTETFQYDNLDRLTTTTVNGVQQLNINYDGSGSFSMGNITSKTDAGNYVYSNTKIHAVNYITNPAGATAPPVTMLPSNEQQITYTPFLKAATVSDGAVQTLFTYGPDYQRIKGQVLVYGTPSLIKYYFGDFERWVNWKDIHYIAVGNSLCVIEKPINGNSTINFVYTDYLGSLLTKTDINGTITAEQNFDAWGRLRDPATWQHQNWISYEFFDRGYTGHEQMPYHGLINMNGRMYDPVQGRMLSPDNYVPDPWHTQGYNRYSYANNNPLKYTDPDGNFIVAAALIAGFINWVSHGGEFNLKGLGNFAIGSAISFVGSGIGAGLAGSFSSIGMVGSGFISGAVSGTFTGALNTMANGGNILRGAWKGGLFGGLAGGVSGLIKRAFLGVSDTPIPEGAGDNSEYFKSNSELENFVSDKIKNITSIEKEFQTDIMLANSENLPNSKYYMKGNLIYKTVNGKERLIGGVTSPVSKSGYFNTLRSEIFISPGLKGLSSNGIGLASMSITHEFIHAYHIRKGFRLEPYSERAASAYSLAYANTYGMSESLKNGFRQFYGYYPPMYSWTNLVGIINLGIK